MLDKILGVLNQFEGKPLGKKRIKELANLINNAISNQDAKSVVPPVVQPVSSKKGTKAFVAYPIGVNGQGFIDGKQVATDVGVFEIKK